MPGPVLHPQQPLDGACALPAMSPTNLPTEVDDEAAAATMGEDQDSAADLFARTLLRNTTSNKKKAKPLKEVVQQGIQDQALDAGLSAWPVSVLSRAGARPGVLGLGTEGLGTASIDLKHECLYHQKPRRCPQRCLQRCGVTGVYCLKGVTDAPAAGPAYVDGIKSYLTTIKYAEVEPAITCAVGRACISFATLHQKSGSNGNMTTTAHLRKELQK